MPLTLHQPICWRQIQRNNFTKWPDLAAFLELTENQRSIISLRKHFPLNLPCRLAEKIQKGTIDDPILKQFLPTTSEEKVWDGFVSDPVGDEKARSAQQLIHKYQGRVLLVCSSACAMHCRYCFRQNFDYRCGDKTFKKELEMIAADSSIHEVILSGGDPLSLRDELLERLLRRIDQLSHIKRVRFHTRFPVGIPERITPDFLSLLGSLRKTVWFVVHINHPDELDEDIFKALGQVRRAGGVLLNQSVLLKGVNDDVDTLVRLSESLVDNGIVPYYLHQLDRVQGAAHFEVEEEVGKHLIREMSARLSGYAVPKYVREIPGEPGKTTIA